ncbi:MAG: recombinase family protein [Rhodopirellula sp.]|nr:recombinase family protein [Rhodopirellula sp.]
MSARTKRHALCYLWRSTSKQEMGIHGQLEWALQTACKHEVNLEASPDDIGEMLQRGLKSYRGIRLDDGISGSRLDRPGFVSLRRAALQNSNISHILIHKSDRFARPEQAVQAMAMETELLHAGLTIVFSNRISEPRERGIHYFERDILLLHEYSQNGEFLTQLAERVLAAQIRLAKGGYWTGGTAPYGFVRVLCDAAGNEIMVLDEKTTIRREGCHVRIRADEQNPERIQTWLRILEWYGVDGWGVQRIANRLNELRIPSPNAGRTREIDGVRRPNSDKWCKKTVKRLIGNQAIIGMAVFGVRSG